MRKNLFGWILFIALAVTMFLLLNKSNQQYAPISIGEFARQLERDRVRYVDVGEDHLTGEFHAPQAVGNDNVLRFRVPLPAGVTADWAFTQWLLEHPGSAGVGVSDRGPDLLKNILIPLIPWLLIFGFIWFFVFRQLRGKGGGAIPGEPVRVYVVNQPGDAMATATPAAPSQPQPGMTPAPGGDN